MKNRLSALLILFFFLPKIILPQEITGNLEGRIVDILGVLLSGVNVT